MARFFKKTGGLHLLDRFLHGLSDVKTRLETNSPPLEASLPVPLSSLLSRGSRRSMPQRSKSGPVYPLYVG